MSSPPVAPSSASPPAIRRDEREVRTVVNLARRARLPDGGYGLIAAATLIAAVMTAIGSGWGAATVVALLIHVVICASYVVLIRLYRVDTGWLSDGLLVALEVSLASTPIVIVAALESRVVTLAGLGIGGYCLVLALAAVRQRPGLPLLAGALAAVQYAAIYLGLLRPGAAGASDAAAVIRIVALLLVSAGVALAVQRRRLGRTPPAARSAVTLEQALGMIASPGAARTVVSRGPTTPQRCTLTVMFCDLRGFTFLCERERPEDVVELLNLFYERAGGIIESHGGTVDRFLGDGLLALFGAPARPLPDHADAAVDVGIAIIELVAELRQLGGVWTHLAVGVGIDTGDVVLAPIGSRAVFEYTVIGSPVNRAARLQGVAEREGRRVIVSDATRAALSRRHRLVSLGSVALKGFAMPEAVFSVAQGSGERGSINQTEKVLRTGALVVSSEDTGTATVVAGANDSVITGGGDATTLPRGARPASDGRRAIGDSSEMTWCGEATAIDRGDLGTIPGPPPGSEAPDPTTRQIGLTPTGKRDEGDDTERDMAVRAPGWPG